MIANVEVLLRKIDDGVGQVRAHYEADLASEQLSDDLLYAIRSVVQDCQSALDWTATGINAKFGKSKQAPYFPLAKSPAEFSAELDKQIRGLAQSQPDIAAVIERHQPYQPRKTELGYLRALSRVNKHQDFTAQTRQETREISVASAEGQVGYNEHVRFVRGGITFGPGGRLTFGPGGQVGLGAGPPTLQGVPVNLLTQRPQPSRRITAQEIVIVEWQFADPPVPVLPTLEALARQVREAVAELRQAASL